MTLRRDLSALLVAAVALSLACGGAGPRDIIPALPGDGTAHTAEPGPGSAAPAEPADPWADRELLAAPETPPPRAIDMPAVERFTLKNGLPVIYVKSGGAPVVHMQLAVKAGSADVARDKMGLAQFAAEMLLKGTRARTAAAIAETIDQVGGSLVANAGHETTLVRCSAMTRDVKTCAGLLADVIVNPVFPAAEHEGVARQLQALVRQRRDDAGKMAAAHLANLLWGDEHNRGWPMSPRTIAAITQADLRAWHRAHFVPGNAILAVSGDMDVKAMRAELERVFGPWRRAAVPARARHAEPAPRGVQVRLVDKPGQTQSHIRIGQLGIPHNDPAFFDHEVMNYVLGGGAFSSRLMRVLRAEGGKSYGATSSFDRHRDRGTFAIATFTRNAEVMATLELIFRELAKITQSGPEPVEVRDAITHLAGAHALRFQAPADLAGALLVADLYELGRDHVKNYPLSIAQVTVESAQQAAARTLTPQHLAVVIVGDARQVAPQLDSAGWRYETVSYLDPIAAYERGAAAEAPAVDPKAAAAARAILDKALAAKGGEARLARVKTMRMQARGKILAGARELPATFDRRFQAPDKLRMDINIDLGGSTVQVVTVLNGDRAWNKQPGRGAEEVPADQVGLLRQQLWLDQELILLRHRDRDTRVEPAGEDTVNGRLCDVVRIHRGDGQLSATLYLDRATRLLTAVKYLEQGLESFEIYSDYRPVGGIQVAHRRQTRSDDTVLEIEVTAASFDAPIDAAVFSAPE